MKSREYWKERYEQLENATHKKSLKTVKELEPIFDSTLRQVNDKINLWYQRIADNNSVSLTKAKKLLEDNELKEFRWTIEEYIKYGKENAINQKWLKELENASAKYHITKLEAQKIDIRQKVEELFNKEYKNVDKALKDGYKESFYRSCYELEKGFNIGKPINKLDNKTLDKIISKPWTTDGYNFSDRIWTSKTDLIDTVHKELTRMYTLGEAPDKAIKNISKKFNVSKSQASRLVQTEMSYFNALADKESYKRLEVEKVEIDATLDNITCGACGSLDGIVVDLKDYEIGVNIPPYHPNCRCTTVPHFEDEFDSDERIARDDDGKQYYVPSTMKYNEWKEKYIVNNEVNKKITFIEISKEWFADDVKKKTNLQPLNIGDKFVYNDVEYTYDGKQVKYDVNEKEKNFAKWLSTKKKNVHFNPSINEPDSISTADLTIDGELYDMKIITGKSSQVLYHNIRGKEKQSSNFLFEATESPLELKELEEQVKKIFKRNDMKFVNKIGIKKGKNFKLYERK